jgi:hypothetical protein
MLRSFQHTVRHYRELQEAALAITMEAAEGSTSILSSVELARYSAEAAYAWRTTWEGQEHPSGSGAWDWPNLMRSRWRRPEAFRLAIWSGSTLCGLAIGHPSTSRRAGLRHTISVDIMEGAPFPHPLRGSIALLVITYAITYGRLLGASRIRLVEPLPGAIAIYRDLGFEVVYKGKRPVYCERSI